MLTDIEKNEIKDGIREEIKGVSERFIDDYMNFLYNYRNDRNINKLPDVLVSEISLFTK